MRRRVLFDAVFAAYVASLAAPLVGEFAGLEAYVGFLVGSWFVLYTGMRTVESKLDWLPERFKDRPAATFLHLLPLVYGFAYLVGTLVAEPPVRSPYVYLGLWNVVVAVVTVAVAREVADVRQKRQPPQHQ